MITLIVYMKTTAVTIRKNPIICMKKESGTISNTNSISDSHCAHHILLPIMHHHLYVCDLFFRADVLISQPVEKLWRTRKFESIDDVKWTYVGMRSGVFRTYPAHRSTRGYDPTK